MERELKVIFSGHVQGCGFRYYTHQLMARYPVRGYVKNLSDGSVEWVGQGLANHLTEAVAAVQEGMDGHIHGMEKVWRELGDCYTGFEIRF